MSFDPSLFTYILIGIGGTILLDIWAWGLATFVGVPATNWGLVGRWIGHMKTGQFIQPKLAEASPVTGERVLGWVVHYLIGMAYGLAIYVCWGSEWLAMPTLLPPLLISWLLLAAPFFIMMPGMGAGIAGAKTPNPTVARLKSVAGHTVFGIGMFITAIALV